MRDSSRPPSPGSCFGTSCAPCAWFVRATLGPRGGPMALGLAIRCMQRCQGIPPMRWAPSHVSSLPALDLTQPTHTPSVCLTTCPP